MSSLFTEEEIRGFHSLSDDKALNAGHIRGPRRRWEIKGSALCGKYTSINGEFTARGTVCIGRYCAFGRYIALLSGNHRTDMPNQQVWFNTRFGFTPPVETKGPVEIGHNVWIGDKVNVLSGVQIGHGAVVAAGSTVTKSVPPFSIVGGNPAQVIRNRFSDAVIEQMLAVRWWDWNDEKIARNRAFFEAAISPDDDMDLLAMIVD